MPDPDRAEVLDLIRDLARTSLREGILAGSAGVFAASETLPALTEDVDVIVDAEWLAAHEREVLADLAGLGFQHEEGTSTFVRPGGVSLDLIGFSRQDRVDRIGGGELARVMVFADLSVLLEDRGATADLPGGGRALSPAALAAAKLLTVRLEKGAKDKLQALLLIAEHAARPGFLDDLGLLLARFPAERIEDALCDAQAALLALSADDERALDRRAGGYAPWTEAARHGLALLHRGRRRGPELDAP